MTDILGIAESLIGASKKVGGVDSRGWQTFWCPFHPDEKKGGKANFGIDTKTGKFKCFLCGESGPSVQVLAKKLGALDKLPTDLQNIKPAPVISRASKPSRIAWLEPVLDETRAKWPGSAGFRYMTEERHISPLVLAIYGLGYGMASPTATTAITQQAKDTNLLMKNGCWMWDDSVVYADPPHNPRVINFRYLPLGFCDHRTFEMALRHRTYGDRIQPLGLWRRKRHKTILVVEGFVDMLAAAQAIIKHGLQDDILPVYTNGAQLSWEMMDWFKAPSADDLSFALVKDTDEPDKNGNRAGDIWEEKLEKAIGKKHFIGCVPAPGGVNPDEAFISGWWPSFL